MYLPKTIIGQKLTRILGSPWKMVPGVELAGLCGDVWGYRTVYCELDDGSVIAIDQEATTHVSTMPADAKVDEGYVAPTGAVIEVGKDTLEPGGFILTDAYEFLDVSVVPGGTAVNTGSLSQWEDDVWINLVSLFTGNCVDKSSLFRSDE